MTMTMTATAVRAEPSATPASTESCLAKPNAPAPDGSHWYYRLERGSGRHCWYVRAQDGSAEAKADHGERAATRSLAPPPNRIAAEAPRDPEVLRAPAAGSGDNAQTAAPPIAPPSSASANWPSASGASASGASASGDWPSAPASRQAAAPAITNAAPTTNDNAAEQTSATPPTEAVGQPSALDVNSGSPVIVEAPIAERPAASATDYGHIPALLGTALVLACIILASVAAQYVGGLLQRRRHERAIQTAAASRWDAPPLDDPGLDIAAAPRPRRHDWQTEPRDARPLAEPAAALALEDNVRELLHRLQTDLKGKSRRPAGAAARAPMPVTPAAPQPAANASGDLEAVLAFWAGKKARR
jgi:hypothetical protein